MTAALLEAGRKLATLVELASPHLSRDEVDRALVAWTVAVHDAQPPTFTDMKRAVASEEAGEAYASLVRASVVRVCGFTTPALHVTAEGAPPCAADDYSEDATLKARAVLVLAAEVVRLRAAARR